LVIGADRYNIFGALDEELARQQRLRNGVARAARSPS
jgi:hypothetical protein